MDKIKPGNKKEMNKPIKAKPKKFGKSNRLTPKQKGFVADYVKTKNGTEAAARNYKVKNRNVAKSIGSENLTKPDIVKRIQDSMEMAQKSIIYLAKHAKNETVRLNASKDILDRGGLKATNKLDIGATDETMEALARLREIITVRPSGNK